MQAAFHLKPLILPAKSVIARTSTADCNEPSMITFKDAPHHGMPPSTIHSHVSRTVSADQCHSATAAARILPDGDLLAPSQIRHPPQKGEQGNRTRSVGERHESTEVPFAYSTSRDESVD